MVFVGRSRFTVGARHSPVGNGYCIEVVAELDELGFDVEQQHQPPEVFGESVEHRAVGLCRIGVIVPHRFRVNVTGGSYVKYARVAYGFDTHVLQRGGIIAPVMNPNPTTGTN